MIISQFDQRRAAAGISRAAVCREAGMAESTYYRWMCGDASPTMASVERVSDALDRLIAGRSASLPSGDGVASAA